MKKHKHNWNYRVLAFPDAAFGVFFKICEVHYTNGKPLSYVEQTTFGSDTKIGLLETLSLLHDCTLKAYTVREPILWGEKKFPKVYEPKKKLVKKSKQK